MKVKFYLLILVSLLLASCASKEQKISENVLKEHLIAPSSYHFISFELEKEETLEDEINDRLELYSYFVSSDSSDVAWAYNRLQFYEDMYKKWNHSKAIEEDYLEHKEEYENKVAKLNRDQKIFDTISALKQTEDCSVITHRIYVLTYESQNAMGVMLRNKFTTCFDAEGELVSYSGDGIKEVNIKEVFSIPGYYDLIKE